MVRKERYEEPERYSDLREKMAHLKTRMSELEEDMSARIAEHPMAAVGVAFGAGAVTGLLLAAILRRR